jgi:hypothetical protein
VAVWSFEHLLAFPVEVPVKGSNQVAVRARAIPAAGGFPTIAIYVDRETEPRTNGCLASEAWQRAPIGVPIELEPGSHTLVLAFLNDFYANEGVDRNLALDRVEVRKVDLAVAGGAADSSSGADVGATAAAREEGAMSSAMSKMRSMSAMRSSAMRAMSSSGASSILSLAQAAFSNSLGVAFTTPLSARRAIGSLLLRAECWWRDAESTRPPRVTLFVNGAPVGSQRGRSPIFRVDASSLAPGENRLALEATLDSGESVRIPDAGIRFEGPAEAMQSPRRDLHLAGAVADYDRARSPSIRACGKPGRIAARRSRPSAGPARPRGGRAIVEFPRIGDAVRCAAITLEKLVARAAGITELDPRHQAPRSCDRSGSLARLGAVGATSPAACASISTA